MAPRKGKGQRRTRSRPLIMFIFQKQVLFLHFSPSLSYDFYDTSIEETNAFGFISPSIHPYIFICLFIYFDARHFTVG